jgi:hypothetical protein
MLYPLILLATPKQGSGQARRTSSGPQSNKGKTMSQKKIVCIRSVPTKSELVARGGLQGTGKIFARVQYIDNRHSKTAARDFLLDRARDNGFTHWYDEPHDMIRPLFSIWNEPIKSAKIAAMRDGGVELRTFNGRLVAVACYVGPESCAWGYQPHYRIDYHKAGMPAHDHDRASTAAGIEALMRNFEPDMRRWRARSE